MKKTLLVCALASVLMFASAVANAQSLEKIEVNTLKLDELFEELRDPQVVNYQRVEDQIYFLWSQSGSASADLLLERGQEAIEAGDYASAIEHLTALTDHAPEFPEGWNARATAFFLADEYGLAMADIGNVLALNPRHFGALSGLALIMEELGEPETALIAYQHVYELHPNLDMVKEAVERLTNSTVGTAL